MSMSGGNNLSNHSGGHSERRPHGTGASRWQVDLTIDSNFSTGFREAQRQILTRVESLNYSHDVEYAIRLALEEALINAIKHGNRLDPSKKVHVCANVTPQQVEIEIEDQGPGFERSSVPDPTQDANLEKNSGRGILLMETFMSRVDWTKGGRRVRMTRKNDAAHRATA